jgi:serine/threonine-protein kinase
VELTEDELKPGLVLGRYELLAPVAKGGMAQVWAARMQGRRGFQKTVAIKTMLPNLTEDPQFEQMFLDEATLASRVRHPNAVEILDLGEDAGILYLVMEWIDGEPLSVIMKQAMQQGGMPLSIAVRIIMQACAGLHGAHELRDDSGDLVGLVHRDVSPQNILVAYSGSVKVVDFGVAKATGRASAETAAGQIKGKVPYMSPEQASGGVIDRRTDLFAAGILLYMMTTGKHPFRKENDAQTLMAICSDIPIVRPSQIVPDYPPELEKIVLRSLDRDVAKRYQTGAEMQKALDALPSQLRASTDEELGDFMKALLPERMAKRQTLIQRALKEAEKRVEGRVSITEAGDEVSNGNLTPLSGISHVGQIAHPQNGSSTSLGIAIIPDTAEGAPEGEAAPPPAERGGGGALRTIGAIVLAVATGGAVYFATSRPPPAPTSEAEPPHPAVAAPAVASPPAATQAPEAPTPSASGAPVEPASDKVVDVELDESKPGDTKTHHAARAGGSAAKVPTKGVVKSAPGAKAAPAAEPPAAQPAAPAKPGTKPFVSPFREPDF